MNKAIVTAILIAAVGIPIFGMSLSCVDNGRKHKEPTKDKNDGQEPTTRPAADEKFTSVDDLLDKRQLTLLGVVLAFLAYVSVGESQIITARHKEVEQQRARPRGTNDQKKVFREHRRKIRLHTLNYLGLLIGDLLLIGTAWLLFYRIVKPFSDPLCGCPPSIPLLLMLAGVILTAIHVLNWTRGLTSIFGNSKNP